MSEVFLSTPSARRATVAGAAAVCCARISIHALREEGDPSAFLFVDRIEDFYPRPPRGGRLMTNKAHEPSLLISIHALREEGDANIIQYHTEQTDFYPRPPRGGRLGR